MFRLITPIIIIGIAVAGFAILVSPMYKEINELRAQSASFNQALANSKSLENERDKLTQRFNAIEPKDLERLRKLLPDSVDNIRLILEIERLASPYGMVLRDVRYEVSDEEEGVEAIQGGTAVPRNENYGSWDLEFAVEGTYSNYLAFLKDLESNLRLVDIVSVQFSSGVEQEGVVSTEQAYKYNFKIRTYWLKN